MLFNSAIFIAFFIVVYWVYRLLPHRAQNLWLLLASYVFYGTWDWRFLSLIALSTVVDFVCGWQIDRNASSGAKKRYLAVSVATNLGILGTFKYLGFFVQSAASMLETAGLNPNINLLEIILPVGISFYTFQTMSYTIDIYRGNMRHCERFLDFALFVSFFPQLVAGPIERAKRLLPQIVQPRRIEQEDISIGLWLVLWGYFLKVYVADNLAPVVDAIFSANGALGSADVVLGAYAFAFQIFGDFAGYSAIAIGISRLMGFQLMTNFLYPYFVTNPQDFWRNWHISLSTWLRDYLYISLGGNRGGEIRTYLNLFLTMLLGGLWHGAAWTFVIWGVYQGALLIGHRLIAGGGRKSSNEEDGTLSKVQGLINISIMFQFTCIGWLIFRAESVPQLWGMLVGLVDFSRASTFVTAGSVTYMLLICAPVILLQYLCFSRNDQFAVLRFRSPLKWLILAAMGFLTVALGQFGGQDFIYFQF